MPKINLSILKHNRIPQLLAFLRNRWVSNCPDNLMPELMTAFKTLRITLASPLSATAMSGSVRSQVEVFFTLILYVGCLTI
jgi:hypothetical protein